ncbi:hypothetical protein FIBSPDRAFT_1039623 [Athelia psychrophila]|uniref:Uncharacterized protein n=1 Tax=Athelia psychrophila TaxID=1759441 RepID=A0A166RPW5_9AGAM|nr:hypothetical protein FIBSPDRAFT_1039623 [Fibularhizoctonia sp. CBS 109695]
MSFSTSQVPRVFCIAILFLCIAQIVSCSPVSPTNVAVVAIANHDPAPNGTTSSTLKETNAALAQIQPGAFSVATAVALFGALSLV